jgi:hypothetical protein
MYILHSTSCTSCDLAAGYKVNNFTKPKALAQDDTLDQLIGLYQNKPCLWDTNDEDYCNAEARDSALRRMSGQSAGLPKGI